MPDTIQVAGKGLRGGCFSVVAVLCSTTVSARAEAAINLSTYMFAISRLDLRELAALGLTLGILCFAVVTAIMLVRTRRRLVETEAAARDEAIALRARADRANALLQSEPQVVIAWSTTDEEPEIIGDPSLVTDMAALEGVLAFGNWLDDGPACAIEQAVAALRARGVGFAMTLTTRSDRLIEAE